MVTSSVTTLSTAIGRLFFRPKNSRIKRVDQNRERDLAGMHMHAAELGAAVQALEYLAGIEQALVPQGAFEALLLASENTAGISAPEFLGLVQLAGLLAP